MAQNNDPKAMDPEEYTNAFMKESLVALLQHEFASDGLRHHLATTPATVL